MKKALIGTLLATTIGTANATPAIHSPNPMRPSYNHGYSMGYRQGKNDAYNHVATTAFVVGVAVIAGVVIYHLSEDSRWGVNEKGVTYRF